MSRTSFGLPAGRFFAAVGVVTIVAGATFVAPAEAKQSVAVPTSYPGGMIIIKQSERQLYFTNGDGTAIRYPVAIGKTGKGLARQDLHRRQVHSPRLVAAGSRVARPS